MSRYFLAWILLVVAIALPAQNPFDQPGAKSQATLLLQQTTAQPGDTVWAGVRLVIPSPWHIYWVNHGGVGEAPSLEWQLPAGVSAAKIHWPLPKKHLSFGSIAYVYEQEVLLMVPLVLSKDLEPGEFEIKASAKWLECTDEECVQGKQLVATRLTVGRETIQGKDEAIFSKWLARLPGTLPALDAKWAGPVTENSWRPLAFRVPVKDQKLEVEFFPYLDPKDEFAVQADVKVELEKGFANLIQQVESIGEKWPSQIPGVMRIGGKGYEVVLEVAEPAESTDKQEAPFLLSSGLGFGGGEKSQVELVLDSRRAKPGQTLLAGVRFKIPEGWHIYHKDPGGPGLPPEFTWVLPKGVGAGEIQWPRREVFEFGGEDFNGYHDEVMLLVPLTVDNSRAHGPLNLRVNVSWQECRDICVLGEASLLASLVVADQSESSEYKKEIVEWQKKVPDGISLLENPTKPDNNLESPGAKTKVTLLLDANEAKAGQIIRAGFLFEIPDKWHIFWKEPGEFGEATKIEWQLPEGVTADEIHWPKHKTIEAFGSPLNVYEHEVMLVVPLRLVKDLKPGKLSIAAKVIWQECDDQTCVPGAASVQAVLAIEDGKSSPSKLISEWEAKVPGLKPKNPVEPPAGKPDQPGVENPLAGLSLPGAESKVTLLLDAEQARTGQTIYAGVRFGIPDKWHIFWKYPGELGEAPKIHWQLPLGVTAGEIRWPQHKEYKAFGIKQNIYEDEVMLLVPLHLAEDLPIGEMEISARVTWQECEISCVQGDTMVRAPLKIGDDHKPSAHAQTIAEWRGKLPGFSESLGQLTWILLLAFGGGLILNLMPCVLPVIALKVMGFVNQRQESSGHARRLGLLYGSGVVFSFLVMAVALLVVRSGAGGETWGMQMQNQWFLLFLAGLMTLVALNLFGVFEISLGGRTMTAADSMARRKGGVGAFANGMLMVALATPCMAPMLGTAIPFALTQPAMITLLVFATVAVGLALPYVVLSFKPNWLRFLPQPGAWMESFKKAMGFPMLAAAAWLMMLAGAHFGDKAEGMLRVVLMLAMLALAAWIFGEFIQHGTRRRALAGVLAVACVGAGFGCLYVFQDKLDWKPWSKQAVAEARTAGHPVLVDFTADWCLTCKMNKRRSIEVDAVRKKIAETGAVVFKADFTRKNPVMADYIKSHGRAGVPLVLVYSPRPDEDPQILPEDLTLTSGPSLVISALDKAAASLEEARKPEEILSPNPRPKQPSVQPVENNQTTEGNQTRKLGNGRPKLPLSENAIVWTRWSSEAIAGARSKGKPVLVDFTADWCAPCKYIEKTAINTPKVRKKLAGIGAVTLKADFTNKDPVVLKEMQTFGRAGPPLVLVYPSAENMDPIVMAKVFTAEDMLKALDEATGQSETQKGLESASASATSRD